MRKTTPTRHIKFKLINFAPSNISKMTNKLRSTNFEKFLVFSEHRETKLVFGYVSTMCSSAFRLCVRLCFDFVFDYVLTMFQNSIRPKIVFSTLDFVSNISARAVSDMPLIFRLLLCLSIDRQLEQDCSYQGKALNVPTAI